MIHCKDVQERILEGVLEAAAEKHISECEACQAYARERELVHSGLALLAKDAAPEPSWGFAARVLRRLDEAPARLFEPLEIIARRAVLAAGALAMTAMMALVLSSSGVLRDGGSNGFSLTRAETADTVETLLAGGVDESEELALLPVMMDGVEPR